MEPAGPIAVVWVAELEQNRETDMRQAEDIATLKAKNDFEQQQIQDLKNELQSLKAAK